jgi:transcriptional regulator GlxA family with amidase domain
MRTHEVAVLALDGVLPLDLGIPTQIFSARDDTPYRLTVCGVGPQVTTTGGFSLSVPGGLREIRRADTVIVPGYAPFTRPLPAEVLDVLAAMHARGRRMVSICTGAFALAAAGVLDGLVAATHWRYADELAARYPRVTVDRDVLYVDEGNVLTSAGVSSGIDLCLHIVRQDLGGRIANRVARWIVAAPHRDGGQAQYIEAPVGCADRSSLASTRAWALANLRTPLTVRDLARHAGVSERTVARRFKEETGATPLQWLLRARVDLARELLEGTDLGVDRIAEQCGFGTAANFRLHFRRVVGIAPGTYRRTFTAALPDSAS